DAPGLNIRVLNLSFATAGVTGAAADPLLDAVRDARAAGIVVVAAAGNDGAGAPLTSPALSDEVIAVGATDTAGTTAVDDDVAAAFSNGGDDRRRPDVLAPGRSVLSLVAPGSAAAA